MTTDKEKKRSMFFWKKSNSQNNVLSEPTTEGMANGQSQELPNPDSPTEFVEKDVNVTSVFGPFIKNYVSNLSHNKSPTKLPYPPNFYYPASSLQHQMNLQMQHIDVLLGANTLTSPLDRFLAVLKYSLTTCNVTKFPYKPIIAFMGETAQSYANFNNIMLPEPVYYAGEQVEREPSTSAFYISTPSGSVIHSGHVSMDPKFKQAHVTVHFVGGRQTILTHPQGAWKETYNGDVPDLSIKLLRMHTELGGNLNLNCPETGISASIQFRDKPLFGGVKNGITGSVLVNGLEVYTIEGTWDGITNLIDSASKAKIELMNRTALPKTKFDSLPSELQPITSGEREWGALIDCLHKGDWEQAKLEKARIDAMHHERRLTYEKTPFTTSFFQKSPAGGWEIKDPNLVIINQNQIGMPTM